MNRHTAVHTAMGTYSGGLRERSSHEHCHNYVNTQEKVPSAPNHSQEDLGLEKGRKQLGHKD